MNKYKDYVVEDFVLDLNFQNWVRNHSPDLDVFWENYKKANPGQQNDIHKARLLLSAVYYRYDSNISEEEIEGEISALVQQIRSEKETVLLTANRPISRSILTWLAAAVVIIVGGLVVWLNLRVADNNETALTDSRKTLFEKINQSNSSQTLILEDSSIVVLEPGARLRMQPSFDTDKREVLLTGTAFFKIRKDVKRPFLVHSKMLTTRVLGTSFTVKANRGSGKEIIEVKEGKVSVYKTADFGKSNATRESYGMVVTSNQKVIFDAREGILLKALSDNPEILPGKAGRFQSGYVNTPVTKVLKDLANAYQVDIIFDEKLLADCPLTATLADQPLREKLTIICEAIEAQYEILDGKVMIYGKSCTN
ncbi:FecR family protein [Dyadobacter bucti]|uniref:FecR family protein n=1 Tax=Dyadobacter bucti TaxID=2572203 RepID=UPI003F6F9445